MENYDIAEIFSEIADLLEIKGESHFRIRSYRNAAAAIEGTGESLKSIHASGGEKALEEIPGIGKSIGAKIEEIIETGHLSFLDKLLDDMPAGILDILKIAGIGPKKAAIMYKELNIGSVEELEKAALSGKLSELAGFGEKTQQKILKSIKDLKEFSGRSLLSSAIPSATAIVERLMAVKGAIEVLPAGSLRRWRESVGDLDIIAVCTDPAAIMEAFTTNPDVTDVVSKGEIKSTVIVRGGLQVDLMVVERANLGSALQHFTGSKGHNVVLRDRAKRMGLKISEYGVFKGKRRVAGATEEEVYRKVGLDWIPPEIRENRGELEAAEAGRLPKPLELEDLRGDLHCHTVASDGKGTIEEMAAAAIERGYEYLAITDHSRSLTVAHGLDEGRLEKHIKKIDAYNKKLRKAGNPFTLLKGAEVDILPDGTLDYPDELLAKLDCVVGAVHSAFNMDEKTMTARLVCAISSGGIDILAHPTGRLIGARPPYPLDMELVMATAAKAGVAMEINSYAERLDLNDVHCRLAKDLGVMLAVSTDAHSPQTLSNMRYGLHTARRGWIEAPDVINTRPLKDILKLLGRSR